MIEPPSPQLLKLLAELRLCSAADVRGCRSRVRRIARDLPAFDSVWIDALLQARRLTPFQARHLGAGTGRRLVIGPCVLMDQLSHSELARTYLARRRTGRELCIVKVIRTPAEAVGTQLAQLEQLTASLQSFAHPSVVPPHSCLQYQGELVTVSRHVPGNSLNQMLVRRGRFPAEVVTEIGRQLIDGLAALEQREQIHGDIVLKNVRLTTGGAAVLVDAGIRPRLTPSLVIRAETAPERYDGTAPELIGTGAAATSRSDMYALGCVLWHLLAGRAPFPTADPLAKLAQHQTRNVDDVRTWAPDTPAGLAEHLLQMTASEPADRPESFAALRQQWGRPRRSGRHRIAGFCASFDHSASLTHTRPGSSAVTRWSLMLTMLLLLSGTTLTLLDRGAGGTFLSMAGQALGFPTGSPGTTEVTADSSGDGSGESESGGIRTASTGTESASASSSRLQPLPAPDARGVIRLAPGVRYDVVDISHAGPLTIERDSTAAADSDSSSPLPEIVVQSRPLRLWTPQLTLRNVHVVWRTPTEDNRPASGSVAATPERVPAMILLQGRDVSIEGCRFTSLTTPVSTSSADRAAAAAVVPAPICLAWKRLSDSSTIGGQMEVRNSVFEASGTAIHASSQPAAIDLRNCLKRGTGSLITLGAASQAGQPPRLRFERVTLRESGPLLRIRGDASGAFPQPLAISASDCVFDPGENGRALILFSGPQPEERVLSGVEFIAEGTLAVPGVIIAGWRPSAAAPLVSLDEHGIRVEGILTAPFEYAGPADGTAADSAIRSSRAPRRGDQLPGINASRLPRISGQPTASREL